MSLDERSSEAAQLLGREVVYSGHRISLSLDRVELPNRHVAELTIVQHPGATAIVPMLGDDVLLVRQYRYATGGWLLEIPAGTMGPGESPAVCAARELEEETGYVAGELTELGWVWSSPGFCTERIWLYLARGLTAARQRLEEDEVLSLEQKPWREVLDLVERGEVHDAKSISALLLAAHRLGLRSVP
jgi:ADP-ribose pyrophosphatase